MSNCGTTTRLDSFEEKLDTDSALTFEFHRIPDDPEGLGLRFPGFVFGFEKSDRGVIGWPLDPRKDNTRVDLTKATGADPATVRSKLEGVLEDDKRIFLSHLVEYMSDTTRNSLVHEFKMNLYSDLHAARVGANEQGVDKKLKEAYRKSWSTLDAFGPELLRDRLTKTGATHVFVYVFGWNSGQTEALRNVNSVHLRLLESLPADVRPLPILVTWPSHWWDNAFGVLSYRNKANDADELGAVALNSLLHTSILPVAEELGVRTVAIGHSFGARALGRALCSRSLLVRPGSSARWDLFIGLQGGFSINRFLNWSEADEGTPCNDFGQAIGKVLLTWSAHDTANTVASWSRHAGGQRGYDTAKRYLNSGEGKQRPVLDLLRADPNGHLDLKSTSAGHVAYVDASAVVRFDSYVKSGRAHSDIYNAQVAAMVAQTIQAYAPARVRKVAENDQP